MIRRLLGLGDKQTRENYKAAQENMRRFLAEHPDFREYQELREKIQQAGVIDGYRLGNIV
jgi:hypothetical protein